MSISVVAYLHILNIHGCSQRVEVLKNVQASTLDNCYFDNMVRVVGRAGAHKYCSHPYRLGYSLDHKGLGCSCAGHGSHIHLGHG